jgi:hypothetical protein
MQNTVNSIKNIVSAYNASFNDEERPVNAIRPSDDILSILATLCEEQGFDLRIEPTHEDIISHLETLINDFDDDFSFDFEGAEYRIIAESSIWNIYVDEIRHIVEDCYDLKLDNIPDFVAFEIDWNKTAENAYQDGYGHTFSSYDFSELEVGVNGILTHYIFRTN